MWATTSRIACSSGSVAAIGRIVAPLTSAGLAPRMPALNFLSYVSTYQSSSLASGGARMASFPPPAGP